MFDYQQWVGEELLLHDESIDDIVVRERKLEQIVDVLCEINEYTWSDIRGVISENIDFDNEEELEVLVEAILEVAEIRPTAQTLILQLITSLGSNNPEFKRLILSRLEQFPQNCEYLSYFMLRLNSEYTKDFLNGYISDAAFFWMAPMIQNVSKGEFDRKLLSLRARSGDQPKIASFLALYDILKEEDWKIHQEIVSKGANPDSIAMALRFDRIDELQEIASHGVFDVNKRIEVCPYERCEFVNHRPTLIQYAAFFGSIKCFKWLYLNGADLTLRDDPRWNDGIRHDGRSLAQFAVAGGKVELVRLCEQAGADFSGCLEIADSFRWPLIAEWLKIRT